ncbi:MAG: hypothetical protein IJ484_08500 [Oscillospiraceae bacterium]|nr:hypothetical protein [Oscillospiraceae bacterium]
MITLIYRGIVALVVILIVWNLFVPEKSADQKLSVKDTITFQLTCAMVVIPMVMRLLMIK